MSAGSNLNPLYMPYELYQGLVTDALIAQGLQPPRPVSEDQWQEWGKGVIQATQAAIPYPSSFNTWREWGLAFQRAYFPG